MSVAQDGGHDEPEAKETFAMNTLDDLVQSSHNPTNNPDWQSSGTRMVAKTAGSTDWRQSVSGSAIQPPPPPEVLEGYTAYLLVPAQHWLSPAMLRKGPAKSANNDSARSSKVLSGMYLYIPDGLIAFTQMAVELLCTPAARASLSTSVRSTSRRPTSLTPTTVCRKMLHFNEGLAWRAKYDPTRRRYYYVQLSDSSRKGWHMPDLVKYQSVPRSAELKELEGTLWNAEFRAHYPFWRLLRPIPELAEVVRVLALQRRLEDPMDDTSTQAVSVRGRGVSEGSRGAWGYGAFSSPFDGPVAQLLQERDEAAENFTTREVETHAAILCLRSVLEHRLQFLQQQEERRRRCLVQWEMADLASNLLHL